MSVVKSGDCLRFVLSQPEDFEYFVRAVDGGEVFEWIDAPESVDDGAGGSD